MDFTRFANAGIFGLVCFDFLIRDYGLYRSGKIDNVHYHFIGLFGRAVWIDFYGFQIVLNCEFPVSLFPKDESFQVVCLVVFRVVREPFVDVCKSFFQIVFCDEPVYFF